MVEEHEYHDESFWRQFFNLTGGSILYCLSALSIIYGIARVLGPLLAHTDALREALPCIGAMTGYEVALLAVLLLIVLWRQVRDDAISLVVLVALFLVATTLALSTVANSGPTAAFYIGLGCAGLGLGKLYAMHRYIGLDLGALSFIGAGLILATNCLGGAHFARLLAQSTAGEIHRTQWLIGWLGLLAAGAMAICDRSGRTTRQEERTPFLNRPAMRILFLAICLAASGIHQYMLAYIFDVQSVFGDYLPLIAIVSLLLLRMCRDLRPEPGHAETVAAMIPFAACVYVVASGAAIIPQSIGIATLWHVPVFLGITTCALVWLWLRQYGRLPLPALAAYGAGILLTVGCSSYALRELNWTITLWSAAAGFMLGGLFRHNLNLCLASVLLGIIGAVAGPDFVEITDSYNMTPAGALAGMFGLGTIGLGILFRDEMPGKLLRFGGLCLTCALFDYFPKEFQNTDIVYVGATTALCAVLWTRTRDWITATLPLLPLPGRAWLFVRQMSGWNYVILSFVLLFIGAWLSLRKGKCIQTRRYS